MVKNSIFVKISILFLVAIIGLSAFSYYFIREEIQKEQLENQYKHVLKELKNGMSIAKTAKLCDTSPATVARLKKKFGL